MQLLEEINPQKIIKDKAKAMYQNICQELIEQNGLKPRAIEICQSLCDKLIQDEKGKDPLLSYERTLLDIKREVSNIGDER